MYPIRQRFPIVLPKERYRDRFGEPSAFLDTNPSMYIHKDGTVTLLVRRVNYRKYADKTFSLGSFPSQSKYVIAKGNVGDLSRWTFEPMLIEYGVPTYRSYWVGPEDIRFLSENTVIATIPECNPSGNPAIFRARLDGSVMNSVKPCYPNTTEKNWMPYTDHDSTTKVLYSVSPLRMKDVEAAEIINCGEFAELAGYHGSTNGVSYKGDHRLFLIHVNRERSYHRWLLFHPSKKTVQVSDEFVFFQHYYIEFPVSLCEYAGKLYVSMGVNDEAAYILELDAPTFPQKLTGAVSM